MHAMPPNTNDNVPQVSQAQEWNERRMTVYKRLRRQAAFCTSAATRKKTVALLVWRLYTD